MPLHITYQNVKDAIPNDQRNCTFGQCELSREHGMDFFVSLDPLEPAIWAEWVDREDGRQVHHRADVVRRHADGRMTRDEAITIVSATDIQKKTLLRKFPKAGMNFVLTNHTARLHYPGGRLETLRPGETEDDRRTRLDAQKERREEIRKLRQQGKMSPPKRRTRRVRARFG